MSDNETHVTLRSGVEQFKQMFKEASLDPSSGSDEDTKHDDVYLNVLEDEVRILQATPGESVLTYGSYYEDYFDEITLECDIAEEIGTDRSGEDFPYRVGAEAILDVEQALTYLDFASDGGTVEVSFTGSTDTRLSSMMRAEGALEAWVKLPGSQDALESVPHWLPLRFDSDNQYTNPNGDPAPVQISTKVSKLERIIDAVDKDRDADFYPIVVEDESFRVDIGDESRSGVSGALGAKSVSNGIDSDVENYYHDGFEEIFNILSGAVELQTAPGGNPLSIVQSGGERVIRHVNGAVENQ